MTDVERAGGRCFEDFRPGMLIRHSLGRTVTKTDNIWFTLLTANTNPIHLDAHYSAQTEFGQPLVNSTFTLALVTDCRSPTSRNMPPTSAGTKSECPLRCLKATLCTRRLRC